MTCKDLEKGLKNNLVDEYKGEYSIEYTWYSTSEADWKTVHMVIKYCPFCGEKL